MRGPLKQENPLCDLKTMYVTQKTSQKWLTNELFTYFILVED